MGRVADFFFGAQPAVEPAQQRDGDEMGGPDEPTPAYPSQIAPVPRSKASRGAMSISMVYRAVGIHAISAKQLGMQLYREDLTGSRDDERLPSTSFTRKPCLDMSRGAFIELTVTSMATDGNAYWRKYRDAWGRVINLELLDPRLVAVRRENGVLLYSVSGVKEDLTTREIQHLKLLRVPGSEYGLGPIQAARAELEGTLDLRDYQAEWFRDDTHPTGTLTSELAVNAKTAKSAKDDFKASQGGKRDVVVLGQGMKYAPILLNPKDAMFVEIMQYSTTQVARLFGAPSSLMLAAVEGNTQTYQNVEQDWLGFVRFSNMQYLIEIEDAFAEILPGGQQLRFNIEALLRTDTKTRYESYKLGIEAGWLFKSEVRKIEKLPAKAGIDKPAKQPAPAEAPTPAPEEGAAA